MTRGEEALIAAIEIIDAEVHRLETDRGPTPSPSRHVGGRPKGAFHLRTSQTIRIRDLLVAELRMEHARTCPHRHCDHMPMDKR